MSSDELRRWARTTEFPDPVRWGDVEARIRAEPTPSQEQLTEHMAVLESARPGGAGRLAQGVVLVPLVLLTVGTSLLGLGFVVAYVAFDAQLPDDAGIVLQLIFGAALLVVCFTFYMWWETRRRGWENLGLSGFTAVVSAVSGYLLSTVSLPPGTVWPSIRWMAWAAAVVGAVGFVFFLVFAKPTPGSGADGRRRAVTAEEQWLRGRRAVVLEEMRKRGLVSDADGSAMVSMPPDAWRDLETSSDGRVVRRR